MSQNSPDQLGLHINHETQGVVESVAHERIMLMPAAVGQVRNSDKDGFDEVTAELSGKQHAESAALRYAMGEQAHTESMRRQSSTDRAAMVQAATVGWRVPGTHGDAQPVFADNTRERTGEVYQPQPTVTNSKVVSFEEKRQQMMNRALHDQPEPKLDDGYWDAIRESDVQSDRSTSSANPIPQVTNPYAIHQTNTTSETGNGTYYQSPESDYVTPQTAPVPLYQETGGIPNSLPDGVTQEPNIQTSNGAVQGGILDIATIHREIENAYEQAA